MCLLKSCNTGAYSPTNPFQSFSPRFFLLISLTYLLLQTACISHIVDLYQYSHYFFPLLVSCHFSLHTLLLPIPDSFSYYHPASLLHVYFQHCRNFTNMRGQHLKVNLQASQSLGVSLVVTGALVCICFTKHGYPK